MHNTLSSRWRARARDERGVALIIALMATMLLTALGLSLIMVTQTETMISANYRGANEALYAADAGVERVVQDLLMIPDWNKILANDVTAKSSFYNSSATQTLPDGTAINLDTLTARLQAETDAANNWGANNPRWRRFANGTMTDLLPTDTINSLMYVAVWAADDPADNDGDPDRDSNGTITLFAQAFGPSGTTKIVEVTVARTSGVEIERGMIAQRGQEELNQRARKAAVQTPGKTLTEMRMGTGGTMAVQP